MRARLAMSNAEQQARSQVESIVEMLESLRNAQTETEREDAQTMIYEDPLEIEVRGEWRPVGEKDRVATEFKILLCTGGPAVRIRGELDKYSEPDRATVEFQDWGTRWEPLTGLTDAEEAAILDYCHQFYFAEC